MLTRSFWRPFGQLVCLAGAFSVVASAAAQAPFTEEAAARGLVYTPDGPEIFGHGIAFMDLDDDGDPDAVCIGAADGRIGLFENDGAGFFTDRFAGSGMTPMVGASSVSAGDYDRDGDLDLYIAGWTVVSRLYRNDGNFTFTDVAAAAGVADNAGTIGSGTGWGDYDNDGWIDLYLANRADVNRLFHNNGDGTFTDVAAALGVDPPAEPTFGASFFDINRDADPDLYLITDKGTDCMSNPDLRNYLYENNAGTLTEITAAANAEACADAMSIAVGDFDGNMYQDIYITNIGVGNVLLMNLGNSTFVEQQTIAGVESFARGWGADFLDFDNDGILDLYVCNEATNNRLYTHGGSLVCTDVGPSLNCDSPFASFAVASADIDADGDLDMIVHNQHSAVHLYVNHEGETRNWAAFDVIGVGPNRYAVNARLDLRTGSTWQTREIIAGHAYKSQNHLVAHFGLDAATILDELVVTWPWNAATRTLTGYAANQKWTIVPPDKLGDADADGQVLLDDFVVFAGCFTGPTPGAVLPGCAVMDFDGDSDVDMDDYDDFITTFDGPIEDCNGNSTADLTDIITGASADGNGNGIPDECECPGDLDGSSAVDVFDLFILLGAWGNNPGHVADLDGSGVVDVFDLFALLGAWGGC